MDENGDGMVRIEWNVPMDVTHVLDEKSETHEKSVLDAPPSGVGFTLTEVCSPFRRVVCHGWRCGRGVGCCWEVFR